MSHAISSLLYARRPASHARVLLLISSHPLHSTPAALSAIADSAALRAKYMAEFAPFLLSPQMMQKIEEAQQNYANETLQAVNAQHAQVCVNIPSLPL